MNTEYINKILEIGKKGSCTDHELEYFMTKLPNVGNRELLPALRENYKIDTSHMTRQEILSINTKINTYSLSKADEELKSFIVDLVKGIHIIEFKSGYGGSSTTTICNLFGTLIKKDVKAFIDLYNWIASNGGNYYIESDVTFEESKKKNEYAEKNRIEMLENDQRVHSDAVDRKKHNRDLHAKASNETQRLYKECKEILLKMSDEQLIDSFNKDVGNPGWVGARARFHSALHEEFENRGFDYSDINNQNSFSWKNKIKLVGKKIIIQNMNNLKQPIQNIPTLKTRFEYLRGILNPTDKEMKELFHLSEEEFKILDKETNQPTQPVQPVEQPNSSAATSPETALSKYMKKNSHRVVNTTQPGTVTQITGYPKPKK